MAKRKSNEEYIEKAKIVHNSLYTYPNFNYINSSTDVKIECSIHGEFEILLYGHLNGQGCPDCSKIKMGLNFRLPNNIFLERVNIIHNNFYDYPDLSYCNVNDNINIFCPIHGIFPQTPANHLLGKGCKKCGIIKSANKRKTVNNENFIKRANKIHNDLYKYPNLEYIDNETEVKIECPIHGEFKQLPYNHLMGKGCDKCAGKNKTNEEIINEANIIHNNFYSYDKLNFINNSIEIIITCPIHGDFPQLVYNH